MYRLNLNIDLQSGVTNYNLPQGNLPCNNIHVVGLSIRGEGVAENGKTIVNSNIIKSSFLSLTTSKGKKIWHKHPIAQIATASATDPYFIPVNEVLNITDCEIHLADEAAIVEDETLEISFLYKKV